VDKMRLRLYIILQIFTFNKIKKKEDEKKANTTTELRKMSKEVYTTLTESTVNTSRGNMTDQTSRLLGVQ